jgi:pyrroline-5-carboxylate reductase
MAHISSKDTVSKIAVIGCGNMGRALIEGFLKSSAQIIACDSDHEKLQDLKNDFGLETTSDAKEACLNTKTIVIAVKPQIIPNLLNTLRGAIDEQSHIISVAAGVSTETFRNALGQDISITRVMPNLPALIGEGVSGIYSDSEALSKEAKNLFSTVGKCFLVSSEQDLNTVTGLSGSGPAFVCYFIEALTKGAVELGLDSEAALEMAIQTVFGTSKFLDQMNINPATLREMVSSPGGTTVSGLKSLRDANVGNLISEAVKSATKRAEELASPQ